MCANGHRWVWMRAMGCRDEGGHKNKASRDINVCAGHNFVPLWPGKFTRTSCFAKKTKKTYTEHSWWARMGSHDCI